MRVLKQVGRIVGAVIGFTVRRRRLSVTVVVAALLFGPLALTGDVELFVLNTVGIGIAGLIVRQLGGLGRRRGHGDR
ncbi:MAG: hypothetical protein F4Z29_13060 [Gemmatimonadetes bacterium]|nr:hypothetical protein [Gemmatimonadota bacterium]